MPDKVPANETWDAPMLVGSRAAQWWYPKHWPTCNDTDLIATFEVFSKWHQANKDLVKTVFPFDKGKKFYVELHDGEIMEWEIAHPGSAAADLEEADFVNGVFVYSDYLGVPGNRWPMFVAGPEVLFALKASHKYLKDSPHFDKTMRDYHLMKGELGLKIQDRTWLKKREKETYIRPRPKLNRSKKDFFSGDSVPYEYDHDSLHIAVAKYGFGDRPAYTYYGMPGQEVLSSRKLWKACTEEMRMRGAIEETYVLALERSAIPYRGEIAPRESFRIALSKVCTSITSGWFRAYCYEHYYKILDMYTDEYLDWFDQGLADGVVKPYEDEAKAS